MSLIEKLKEAVAEKRTIDRKNLIYDVGGNVVAKVYSREFEARNEWRFGKLMSEGRIYVPEFYELVHDESLEVKGPGQLTFISEKKDWFIFMERVYGQFPTRLRGEEKKIALTQYKEQLRAILEMGVCPKDYEWAENFIFNQREKKLYLIDFAAWKMGKKSKDFDYFEKILKRDYVVFFEPGGSISMEI